MLMKFSETPCRLIIWKHILASTLATVISQMANGKDPMWYFIFLFHLLLLLHLLLLREQSPLRRLDVITANSDLDVVDLKRSVVEQLYRFLKLSIQDIRFLPLFLFLDTFPFRIICKIL